MPAAALCLPLKSIYATYVYTRANIFHQFYYAFGLDNITFFNGVFQNVDSVALFFGKCRLMI